MLNYFSIKTYILKIHCTSEDFLSLRTEERPLYDTHKGPDTAKWVLGILLNSVEHRCTIRCRFSPNLNQMKD